MNKNLKKLVIILIAITIGITSVPAPTSAFFSFLFKNKETQESFSLFIPEKYTIEYIFESKSEKEPILNIISNNYLLGVGSPVTKQNNPVLTKTIWVTATAYSSTPDQTDSSPFITASGSHVRDGVVAANFLPFGTIIKIPDMYGNKTFSVEDRMNRRYQEGRIDIWFSTREQAKEFGVRNIKIEILV